MPELKSKNEKYLSFLESVFGEPPVLDAITRNFVSTNNIDNSTVYGYFCNDCVRFMIIRNEIDIRLGKNDELFMWTDSRDADNNNDDKVIRYNDSNGWEITTEILPQRVQEMYEESNLFELSLLGSTDSLLKAISYIKNLPLFLNSIQEIRNS